MKKFTATSITLLLLIATSTPAFGWGDKGHKTVGQIAQMRLNGTPTMTKIKQILQPNETLSTIATWADKVKNEKSFGPQAVHADPDTQDFFRHQENVHNRRWHFVDLPLNCSGYDDVKCKTFTSSSDIVHVLNMCIRKLRNGNVPQLTKRNALRLVVHLVGDLHQPLHVGVGFINVDDDSQPVQIVIERDPVRIKQNDFPSDIGANKLLISGADSDNLHSFWDTDLVEDASDSQSVSTFATSLNNLIPASPPWDGQGSPNNWLSQWASDTLHVSNEHAYEAGSVTIKKVVIIDDEPKYQTKLAGNYKTKNIPFVKLQLEKGGYRLAKLLEAIFS